MATNAKKHHTPYPKLAFAISVFWIFIIYGVSFLIHRATQNSAFRREAESPEHTDMGKRPQARPFTPAHEYERSFDWNVYLFETKAPAKH